MAIITISREYGSGGDEVADRVCELLGYTYFDKQQINRAAEEAGISPERVIDFPEGTYRAKTFFDRLFGQSISIGQMMTWMENPAYFPDPSQFEMTDDDAIALIRQAILLAYQVGNMVIVGRGGQNLLKKYPHVLHIRIEAPLELRIQNVLRQSPQLKGTEERKRQEARDLIQKRDQSSAEYIRNYYHADWADAELYHALLNMGLMSVEQAAQTIVTMLQIMETAPETHA